MKEALKQIKSVDQIAKEYWIEFFFTIEISRKHRES